VSTNELKLQLSKLMQLQAIDKEAYRLRNEKSLKPQELQQVDAAFELKKKHLADLEKQLLDLQKQRKERELDVAAKNESVNKLKTQLYSLKTNKEYQAMQSQIQDAQADASMMEEKIIEIMVQSDTIKADVEQEKSRLKEEEKVFLTQKKAIEDAVREIDSVLAQKEADRKRIIPDIDAKILAQYERILASKDGLAIVPIRHDNCGGCNLLTPPQVVNLIKMYEQIVTCEMCNRMLYVDE
jgi:uncharacterized protein